MKRNLIILIPAYQPEEKFVSFIQEIHKAVDSIIVVDDGGGEGYKEIFNSITPYATVLTHEVNYGKGKALKTGLQYIKNNFTSYIVVTMDCDGQHKIEDAKKLFQYNQNHLEELVLGSRKFDHDVPIRSQLGNTITRKVFSMVTKTKIFDTQTGLRSFSDKLTPMMLTIEGDRFEYEINVLLECAKNEIPIHEIWIETIYFNHNSGSHFHTVKDSFKIYKQIFRYRRNHK